MTKRTPPDATTRLLRARKAAAKELRLPVTDWRVRRYALLMNAHDNLTAQLAAGAGVSIDGLLKLDASMQEIRATIPPEPIKVKIEYVQGVVGLYTCKHCGKRNELPEGEYTPPPKKDYPRTIDAEAVKVVEPSKTLTAPKASPAATPSPANATPESKPVT
jgi:hypothetical protein